MVALIPCIVYYADIEGATTRLKDTERSNIRAPSSSWPDVACHARRIRQGHASPSPPLPNRGPLVSQVVGVLVALSPIPPPPPLRAPLFLVHAT